jgi:3-oxocholest-4-en-26-oyl-CoA dehydrogenase beta subunit
MDFSLSAAQTELAGLTRKILAGRDAAGPDPVGSNAVGPNALGPNAGGSDPVQRQWADLASAGVLAAGLPESLGGAGLGLLEQCAVLTELGRAVSLVPYLASVVLAAGAIAEFGSQSQQRRWAVPAGLGSVVLTVALAEEDGDDPASPSVRAERAGRGWRLSGVKTVVPAATRADLMLVPASGAHGVLVFLVEPSDRGVTLQPQALTDGADAGRLVLDDAVVGDDRVLGGASCNGSGGASSGASGDAAATDWLVARATVGVCAAQTGVLERALELTAEYARSREQFGRPIGSFQAVAQRLADAYVDVEAVRLTMWQAAWLLAAGRPGDPEVDAAVASAKFWAADAGHRVAHTAVHVHGGMGIDTSYPLHRYFLAAKRAEFTLGGATAQLRRLGDVLAGETPT